MRRIILAILLVTLSLAHAQTRMPARQVPVDDSGWTTLQPEVPTTQSVFDFLDTADGLFSGHGTNTTVNADAWIWLMEDPSVTDVGGTWGGSYYFQSDPELTSTDNWEVTDTTWGASGVDPEDWPEGAGEDDPVVIFTHPPFVTADGIMFPSFVTKEEFYSTLNLMGFANYDFFTFHSSALYGSPSNNVDFVTAGQYWEVPAGLTTGQVIRVHLWGAGGGSTGESEGGVGGYTYGEFVVVDSYDPENPQNVTEGTQLAVHVGPGGADIEDVRPGRAAIWRVDCTHFNSYTNELLVAGAGGQGARGGWGQPGGGEIAWGGGGIDNTYPGRNLEGEGGTQAEGGTRGTGGGETREGTDGARVWGGTRGDDYRPGGHGGDGYYGGGGGSGRSSSQDKDARGAGGSGSSFIAEGITGELFQAAAGSPRVSVPPGASEAAYGLNAGYSGNPARVAFEIRFDSWE